MKKTIKNIIIGLGAIVSTSLTLAASPLWISISEPDNEWLDQYSSTGNTIAMGQNFISPHTGSITSIGVKFNSSFSGSLSFYSGLPINDYGHIIASPIATEAGFVFNGIDNSSMDFQTIELARPIPVVQGTSYSFLLHFDAPPILFSAYVAPIESYPEGFSLTTLFAGNNIPRDKNLIFEIRGKFEQKLTFISNSPVEANIGDIYTPIATSNTSLSATISVDSESSAVCSFSGGIVTFNSLGNCVVLADQAGDDDFLEAEQVSQSITVIHKLQTINFTSPLPSNAIVGGTYSPTATSTSDLSVVFSVAPKSINVCSIEGGLVSFEAVGTCLIFADQAGNGVYSSAEQISQSIEVGLAAQTISFTSPAPTEAQVGGSYAMIARSTSDLPVTFSIASDSTGVCSLNRAEVVFEATGTCTVLANQGGDNTYAAAEQVQQTFVIAELPAPPAAATPVPGLGMLGIFGLAGAIGAAGVAMNRKRKQGRYCYACQAACMAGSKGFPD